MKLINLRKSIFIKNYAFSLIELLVVIAIIAVLATIGVASYRGAQVKARDARRRADIDAISQALETQKPALSDYPVLATTFFSSQLIPTDPINTVSGTTSTCGTVCQYCFTTTSTPITSCTGGSSSFISSATTSPPTGWGISPTWTVCANLEGGGAFCKSNAQ